MFLFPQLFENDQLWYLNIHIDIWKILDVLSIHFVLSGIRTRSPPYFTLLSGQGWVEKSSGKKLNWIGIEGEETGAAIFTDCNLHKSKRYVRFLQTLPIIFGHFIRFDKKYNSSWVNMRQMNSSLIFYAAGWGVLHIWLELSRCRAMIKGFVAISRSVGAGLHWIWKEVKILLLPGCNTKCPCANLLSLAFTQN